MIISARCLCEEIVAWVSCVRNWEMDKKLLKKEQDHHGRCRLENKYLPTLPWSTNSLFFIAATSKFVGSKRNLTLSRNLTRWKSWSKCNSAKGLCQTHGMAVTKPHLQLQTLGAGCLSASCYCTYCHLAWVSAWQWAWSERHKKYYQTF